MRVITLLQRLLRAIVASGPPVAALAACTEPPRPSAHEPPSATAAAPTLSAASAPTPRPTPAPTPSAAPSAAGKTALPASWGCGPSSYTCECFAPFSVMHTSPMTPNPSPPFKHSSYDKNGCAPLAEVTSGCCNGAAEGPIVDGGKCCYRVTTGSCCGRPLRLSGRPIAAALRRRPGWG